MSEEPLIPQYEDRVSIALNGLRVHVLRGVDHEWISLPVIMALELARLPQGEQAIFVLNHASVDTGVLDVAVIDLRLHLALAHARNNAQGSEWAEIMSVF